MTRRRKNPIPLLAIAAGALAVGAGLYFATRKRDAYVARLPTTDITPRTVANQQGKAATDAFAIDAGFTPTPTPTPTGSRPPTWQSVTAAQQTAPSYAQVLGTYRDPKRTVYGPTTTIPTSPDYGL